MEWSLSRGYYEREGAAAFLTGEVPFGITSSGELSEDAAAILFAALEGSPPVTGEPIHCLELGPGSGLFAKLLLDEFRLICGEHRRDYYGRLVLVLADSSGAMLEAIGAGGLLSGHEGHYELVQSDPRRPGEAGGALRELRAAFLNYVLDSLPASVVRRGEHGVEQLCVRTRLAPGVRLEDYTDLTLEQVVELAATGAEASAARLSALFPALVLDGRYQPAGPGELPEADALTGVVAPDGGACVHSHGAIACLREISTRLLPGGFMLINDFPSAATDPGQRRRPYRVYGGAIATGLNFDQLRRVISEWPGCSYHAPAQDDERLVSRLIGRDLRPGHPAVEAFADRFHAGRRRARSDARERAAALVDQGRLEEARTAFEEALARAPADWLLAEQAASFLAYKIKDRDAAQALAERGLELNPLATGLWNVLGDCALHAGELRTALDAFERATALNPREVRGRYNAAYALDALGDRAGALRVIAEALALDDGSARERLLAKQARILDRLARAREAERDRRRDRIRYTD